MGRAPSILPAMSTEILATQQKLIQGTVNKLEFLSSRTKEMRKIHDWVILV